MVPPEPPRPCQPLYREVVVNGTGNPWVSPAQPVSVPAGTHTRIHRYGFQWVQVTGLQNPGVYR
jgi:hypothetical protein